MHGRLRFNILPALLGGLAALALSAAARADVFVIAHTDNPQKALTEKEAVDLFMGRRRAFTNGDFALVFDLPREHPVRAAFYRSLTGMTPAQINSYWSRLMFTGQTMPPQALPDERAVIELVKRNPSALGYVGAEPADKSVRVVLVLKDKDKDKDAAPARDNKDPK
jgi:ABC-type phosphate transport system substrate-binding protein